MFIHLYTYLCIMDKKKDNNPFPVRLGEIKKPLQSEATEKDRSLHWLILSILKNYVKNKK